MRESSMSTLFIFLYASTHALSSSNAMNAKFNESPVFQSRTMSHDSMRPKRLKMISKSASSVALLSLAMKSSFLGTSTSACGRSPIISRTSACDLAFFSASRAARSASVRPSSFSLAAAPYATRAVTRSAGCTSCVGDGGQSGKSGGSGNGSSSTCACVILTSSQGRPSASRYSAPIFCSTSMPSATSPTTQWPPASRCSVSSPRSVKKNCEPYAWRSPWSPATLPMDATLTRPARSCGRRCWPRFGPHVTKRRDASLSADAAAPPRPVAVGSPVCARQFGWTWYRRHPW
mmetsp:Transcript_1134/g.3368  ORF Transcript_1134/g.3368 Transcript_1134/m.3368 type:complete len:290 (-) Transcript_1134:244-1113(-)